MRVPPFDDSAKLREFLNLRGVLDYAVTGSSYTVHPPVVDTDHDYLVYVQDLDEAGKFLLGNGWTNCFEDWKEKADKDNGEPIDDYTIELADGARFQAWRSGKVNIIVTDDETLHLRSRAATLLCKSLNLQTKQERIALFRCIKFGEPYNGRLW